MKRKFIAFISALAIVCSAISLFALVGCSDKPKIVDVSTAEEFAAADGIVNLKNDIDFENKRAPGGKIVYGNGYKIYNGYFPGDGLALGTKDLTIEDFSITAKETRNFGFFGPVVYGKSRTEKLFFTYTYFDSEILNVHIKNCKVDLEIDQTATECNIGGFFGTTALVAGGTPSTSDDSKIVVKDCSIEGMEITVTRPSASTFWSKSYNINLGGIAGSGMDVKMSDTFVKDCKLTVIGGHPSDNIRVGGLMGYMKGSTTFGCTEITHCYVKDSIIKGDNRFSTGQDVTGGRVTADVRVGGLVCDGTGDGKITACYSEGNEIVSASSGDSYAGGIACDVNFTVTQCYAVNNSIVCSGRSKDDTHQADIRAGGIAASLSLLNQGSTLYRGSINSSFAFNNSVDIELKDVNSKFYYLAAKKVTVCKDFLAQYLGKFKTDKNEAAQFLTDTLNRDDADKEAVQELIDHLAKRFADVGDDYDSVSYYLGTYYDYLRDEFNKLDNIYVGGLLGTAEKGAKINKCAADLSSSTYHSDRFCRTVLDESDFNKSECYVTNGSSYNNHGCPTLTPEQTYGGSLIDKLQLTDEKWTTSESGLPVLAI